MSADVFGLLNIDKPLGMTSHDVVDWVRRHLGVKKVGHAGTLDPQATGVLVVCLGAATRLSEYIMGHTKTYRATLTLGTSTDTYDAEGQVTAQDGREVSAEELTALFPQFKGYIQQIPPMYSAIKQDGEKLYEKARRGEEVERAPREVAIYRLQLEAFSYPQATLLVRCSAGTYIRSLAHDLGQALGVGAHLSALRRLSSGENFTVDNAVTLETLEAGRDDGSWREHVMGVELGLSNMPRIELNNHQEAQVRNGQSIVLDIGNRGLIQAWTDEGLFVGVMSREGEDDETARWKPEKVFNLDAADLD